MLGTRPTMGKTYSPKDHYFKKAKAEGYRARSAFKLEEIVRRFALIRSGGKVLDMGAAPGGFLQVIAQAIGPQGMALGVDLAPIRTFKEPQVRTAVMDVLADDFEPQLRSLYNGQWDAVISDLAPKTSGIKSTDEARSLRLAETALDVARKHGKPGSGFVVKLFMGGDFESFRKQVREVFEDVKVVRPEATRGASVEVYLVGLKRRAVQS